MVETTAVAKKLILASASNARRQMLEGAGLAFVVEPASIDERGLRKVLEAEGQKSTPSAIAGELAAAKALAVSRVHPEAIVIGSDQILGLGRRIFEKPADLNTARRQLFELRGRMHDLHSGVALAEAGKVVWQHVETATLTMRLFTPAFLDQYVEDAGEAICQSVGAYQLEGRGIQLFERVEGDYFTILGLPLLALLGELRRRGVILP